MRPKSCRQKYSAGRSHFFKFQAAAASSRFNWSPPKPLRQHRSSRSWCFKWLMTGAIAARRRNRSNSDHGSVSASCLSGWRGSSCSPSVGIRKEIWAAPVVLVGLARFDQLLPPPFNFPVENLQALRPSLSHPSGNIAFSGTTSELSEPLNWESV